MSKYTTALRWCVEQKLADLKLPNVENNWFKIYDSIGLADYPIFDELYRETLNNKIIRAYYFREIGFETLGHFRWQMRRTMFEIMPYYNQLYNSEDLITNPMLTCNMDYTEKWTRDELTNRSQQSEQTADATTANSSTSTSEDRNIFQDTPMNGLDTGAIKNMDYATNVTFDDGTAKSIANASSHSESDNKFNENYTGDFDGTKQHNEKGYSINQSELLIAYRKTFLNIDLQIIDELNILFMGLW